MVDHKIQGLNQGLHITAKLPIRGLRIKMRQIRGLDGLNGLGIASNLMAIQLANAS